MTSIIQSIDYDRQLTAQGAPIAGYILDAASGEDNGLKAYRPSIFYAGGMALAAAVLAAGIRLKTEKSLAKKL